MNNKAKLGTLIDFHVVRDGKVIHEFKDVHNIIDNSFLSNPYAFTLYSGIALPSQPANSISLWDTTCKQTPSVSTYTQSGTTLTRASGSDTITQAGDLYVWPDGTKEYLVSGSGAGPYTMSKSLTKSTPQVLTKYLTNNIPVITSGYKDKITNSPPGITPTTSGVTTTWESNTPISVPISSSYTLRRITFNWVYSGNAMVHFDLPTPIAVSNTDLLIINSIRLSAVFDTVAPKAAATTTNFSSAATVQRLIPSISVLSTDHAGNYTTNKIHFVTTPNAIALPNNRYGQTTTLLASSLTAVHTVDCVVNQTVPQVSSDFASMSVRTAVIQTPLTDIKQIYWSNASTQELLGVLEFVTPQTIPANKAIIITHKLTASIEVPS